MSDLVKQLRAEAKAFTNHEKLLTPIQEEAADRIEELEREKASWKGAYDGAVNAMSERIDVLTSRIEQLEAALRQIAELSDKGSPTVFARDCTFYEIAQDALGEKKDG